MGSDTAELRAFIDELREVPREVAEQGVDIVDHSSQRIEHEWKMRWEGHEDIPHLPRAITHEVHVQDDLVITGEIGPEKHRLQGRLGSFIELGTRTSPPIPGGYPAADAEEPRFIREIEHIKLLGVE